MKGRWRRVVPPPGVDFEWKGGSTLASTLNGREEGSSLLLASISKGREVIPPPGINFQWKGGRRLQTEGRWGRVVPPHGVDFEGNQRVVPPPCVDFEGKGGGGGVPAIVTVAMSTM